MASLASTEAAWTNNQIFPLLTLFCFGAVIGLDGPAVGRGDFLEPAAAGMFRVFFICNRIKSVSSHIKYYDKDK